MYVYVISNRNVSFYADKDIAERRGIGETTTRVKGLERRYKYTLKHVLNLISVLSKKDVAQCPPPPTAPLIAHVDRCYLCRSG